MTPEEASKLSPDQLRAASLALNDQELAAAVQIAQTPTGSLMMKGAMDFARSCLCSGDTQLVFMAILIRIGFVTVAEAGYQRQKEGAE